MPAPSLPLRLDHTRPHTALPTFPRAPPSGRLDVRPHPPPGSPPMARWKVLFKCIGQAVCANGVKALAGLVPFGAAVYDIADDACRRLREEKQEEQLRDLVEQVVLAPPEEVKREAEAVAREVPANRPGDVQLKLACYLAHVPAAIRQSLRRPADPKGLSVPVTFSLKKPEDLLQLLPARPPRFQPGDRPAGLGDWQL